MNNVIYNYLIKNFFKIFFYITLIFYCFGLILNLFEEIEFFKNLNVNISLPLILTAIYIPSMIISIMPFIVFISSMWFMMKIRNNKDLLTLKVFGFSNVKIFLILAFLSFLLGWALLFFMNPITSTMSKYYEKTKSEYSRDIDHLISFNKNGLWIKENVESKIRIISADKASEFDLINVTIYHLDNKSKLINKIFAKKAYIKDFEWVLFDVTKITPNKDLLQKDKFEKLLIKSTYNYEKINSLFKNFNTISFLNLLLNYNSLIENGYNKNFLSQSLHTMLSLPFYLFLMTALAAIFTMNNLRKSNNFRLITLGLITCILTFYLKDLSIALGQTGKISLTLGIWAPVIILSFFTCIGVLQINEK